MARTSAPSARQGRRLLAAMLAALSMTAAAGALMTPPTRAAAPLGPAAEHTPGPPATETPPPLPSPPCFFVSTDPGCASPSPTPSVITVSPVPDPPSAAPTTPSYLVGSGPSSSPIGGDTSSSPVPLGGGFVDQIPTPSPAAPVQTETLATRQSGVPLPYLAVGALLILGAVGSLIYAVAPRDKNVFASAEPRPAPRAKRRA